MHAGAYTGIKPGGASLREKREFFFCPPPGRLLPPLAYFKSTTCPLGGPFSIQGLYITIHLYSSVVPIQGLL